MRTVKEKGVWPPERGRRRKKRVVEAEKSPLQRLFYSRRKLHPAKNLFSGRAIHRTTIQRQRKSILCRRKGERGRKEEEERCADVVVQVFLWRHYKCYMFFSFFPFSIIYRTYSSSKDEADGQHCTCF